MNTSKQTIIIAFISVLFISCASVKDVAYLQDIDNSTGQEILQPYEVKIQPDDQLAIMVNSTNTELAQPFNKPMVSYQSETGTLGIQRILGYLVDKEGYIDFPLLGKLHIVNLTRKQATELIRTRLIQGGLLEDPIVTMQFLNFKISVMGEVARPGSFTISGDRITLFEALSMAGDLTIYGQRDRVSVIRETDNKRTVVFHDLRTSDIFNSEYYYLQQNDIVYVQPNKARAGQSGINQNNSVGILISVVSLITTISVLIFK